MYQHSLTHFLFAIGAIKDIIVPPGFATPPGLGPNAVQYRNRISGTMQGVQNQPIKRLCFEVVS